jgi:uncharacterized glyoxalase superfamily protein PhnB
MSDPLDALRAPIPPIDPDRAFAQRLRERLRRAIFQSRGAAMSTSQTEETEGAWGPAIAPYIGVRDARRALDWYVQVFDAVRRGEPFVNPDGSIGHAELGIGDAVLMLAEYGPAPAGQDTGTAGPAHSVFVSVPDVDETVRRATAGGAEVERPAADEPYGRTGVIVDPFGHRWIVNTRPRWASQSRPGDIVYMTVFVRDEDRLREFYGSVLGRRVLERTTTPTVSIWGIHHEPATGEEALGSVPVYRVPDVDAAVERVRAGGGQAEKPEERPHGWIASAIDPEGNHFSIWQPPRVG